jgi:hypothetical protein
MFGVDLCTGERDGRVVAALPGELDVVDAANVIATLVRARKQARHAWGDLLLAAPLAFARIRLMGVFLVDASVGEDPSPPECSWDDRSRGWASRSRGCDMISARSSVSWPGSCSSRYRHLFRCAFALFQARDLETRRPSPLSIGASND